MLKCREVVNDADQFLSADQTLIRRLQFKFHLFICKKCAVYVRQFDALKRAIPFMHRKASDEEVSKVMESIDD